MSVRERARRTAPVIQSLNRLPPATAGGAAMLDKLELPIVQAPLAGGPSTPELAPALARAGGMGFVAAGYRTPDALRGAIDRTPALTDGPFGVNLFAPTGAPADPDVVRRYAERLAPEAERAGVALGEPRFDDDWFDAKLAIALEGPVAVVSFTFGCPPAETIERVRASGREAWVTVTTAQEARAAADAGADALVVQGVEAGGHRGAFADREDRFDSGLLALLQVVAARVDLPLVAAGGGAAGGGGGGGGGGGAAGAAPRPAVLGRPPGPPPAPRPPGR